jgi:CRISPR/Cas system CSM-associated protein Csm2 small subunit
MVEHQTSGSGEENLTDDAEFGLSELLVNGYGEEYTVPLDQDVVRIGRGKGSDIVLEDPELQLVHCEIWKQKGHYVLVDKEGEDGTSVNGRDVEFHVLQPGDRIQVGDASLTTVQAEEEGDGPEPLDPEEATDLFDEGPTPDQPPRTPRRRSMENHDESATTFPVRSGVWTWAIIGFVFLLLGGGTGYAYYQYTNTRTARRLLQRAEHMKEDQQYQQALSVLSNRLLKTYPSSSVASSARDLRRNLRTILNQKKHIQSKLDELKSSLSTSTSRSVSSRQERMEETLDQINKLQKQNEEFLRRYFGSPSDPGTAPKMLEDIKKLKATVTRRLVKQGQPMSQ